MTNAQGTKWESEIVSRFHGQGHDAGRYPKMASQGEPDLWIGRPNAKAPILAVAWKRLVGKMADGRRKADGAKEVVILSMTDFLDLVTMARRSVPTLPIHVQAKWTVNLNVTRTLGQLQAWHKGRL
jgi:hypothetical protein